MKPASEEFREWFKIMVPQLLRTARRIIADGEEHMPMMFVFPAGEGGISAKTVDMGEKDEVAKLHWGLAQHPSVYAAILVTECWTVMGDKKDELPAGSLEHVPGRTESLMLSARRGEQQMIALCPINRPAKPGKLKGSTLGEPVYSDAADPTKVMSGRFVDQASPTKH